MTSNNDNTTNGNTVPMGSKAPSTWLHCHVCTGMWDDSRGLACPYCNAPTDPDPSGSEVQADPETLAGQITLTVPALLWERYQAYTEATRAEAAVYDDPNATDADRAAASKRVIDLRYWDLLPGNIDVSVKVLLDTLPRDQIKVVGGGNAVPEAPEVPEVQPEGMTGPLPTGGLINPVAPIDQVRAEAGWVKQGGVFAWVKPETPKARTGVIRDGVLIWDDPKPETSGNVILRDPNWHPEDLDGVGRQALAAARRDGYLDSPEAETEVFEIYEALCYVSDPSLSTGAIMEEALQYKSWDRVRELVNNGDHAGTLLEARLRAAGRRHYGQKLAEYWQTGTPRI